MQRCNVHLAYLGQANFIELTLRTSKVSYKFFGIDNPVDLMETVPAVIGTLTSEESSTLDMLLNENPHTMLETTNYDKSDTQPHEDEPVIAHVKTLSDNYNTGDNVTHKNQDSQEIPHTSYENTTGEDTNIVEKLNLISQDNDDSDSTIIYDVTENVEKDPISKTELDTDKGPLNTISSASVDNITAITVKAGNSPKPTDTEIEGKITLKLNLEIKHYE